MRWRARVHPCTFEDEVAWLGQRVEKTVVTLLWIRPAAVGRILEGSSWGRNPVDGLRKIDVDQQSWRRRGYQPSSTSR